MYIVRNQTWSDTRFPENKVLGNSGEREQLPFIYYYRLIFGRLFVCQFYLLKKIINEWILRTIAIRRFEDKKKCIFFITVTRSDKDRRRWAMVRFPLMTPYFFLFFFTIVKYFFLYIWIHCGCKGSFMYLFYKLS